MKKRKKKTPTRKRGGKRPKRMTLGGRKRHLSVVIDAMISDAYPGEAQALGQWLMEMGHMIVLSELTTPEPPIENPSSKIQQTDLSIVDRDIPPDRLN